MTIERCRQYLCAFSILLTFSAFAGDPLTEPRRTVMDAPEGRVKAGRAVRGMPFDLPSEVVKADAEVTLAVRNGDRLLVSEKIALPAELSGVTTVSFLSNHENELRLLRTMNRAKPGLLRFTVSTGDQVVAEMAFADADSGSAGLADGGKTIGSSRTMHMNMRPPRTVGADGLYPDPECVQGCGDVYYECMNVICDQRGDCSYCVEDYEWCESQCPLICEEPKQVYEYGTSWQSSGTTTDDFCWQNMYEWRLFTDWEARDIYVRTVACNNTYTDVYDRTETRIDDQCKWWLGLYCSGNQFYNVPDCNF